MSLRIQGETLLLRPFREQEAATLWDHESADRGDFEVPWPDDEVSRERVLARVAASGSWRDQHVLDLGIETSGVLIGDVNGSGVVTSGDTNLCKAQALQPVTSANFRNDVNASGSITTGDVNIIKQNALTHVP